VPSLFDLSNRLASIEALLEAGLPESPEAEAELDRALAEELATRELVESKAEAYCGLISEMEALAAVRKTEADRVGKLAKATAAQAERLRKALKEALILLDVRKLSTDRYQISLRKPGGKAPLEIDEFMVPTEFVTVETITNPNKDLIRQRLDAGEVLDFARYLERQDSLIIR
jgi:hypothetical protein